ncbi:MAG TPA: nitronate monooxygenase [Solirubrobacterales bacterium]|nr:nitronate monooxygenase [Solirubrobacterales bacterium]
MAVPSLLARIGIELPVIQAGMGGGLAGPELAAAVSEAGGLGTIGMLGPAPLGVELAAARRLTAKPIAVNLLLPFARSRDWEAAQAADAVVTFWGVPERRVPGVWIHQCGSAEEALAAREAGADAVIAQGSEAGGHVRGTMGAQELLERLRAVLGDLPVLSAGGVATAEDLRVRLDAGADAVVAGTRFLMSAESGAHPDYKRRLLDARQTLLTELFGTGWPAPHRVIPNAATRRWLRDDPRGPGWLRAANRISAPVLSRVPPGVQSRLAASQTPRMPMFGPAAATAGGDNLLEAGPLYAGECVARIDDIRPAAELVRDLAG